MTELQRKSRKLILTMTENIAAPFESVAIETQFFAMTTDLRHLVAETRLCHPWKPVVQNRSFFCAAEDFFVQNRSFFVQNRSFLCKTEDFLCKTENFLCKTEDFCAKHKIFLCKTEVFCAKQ